MKDKLIKCLADLDEKEALRLAKEMVNIDGGTQQIIDSTKEAMVIVGERFEKKEYFVADLLMSGEILKNITGLVEDSTGEQEQKKNYGKVLMGTVVGDIHDIGKNIVSFMLDVNGFEVKDIGVDIPVEDFVAEVEEFQPQVIGMSGLLTTAYDSMKDTIKALGDAGLRDNAKIMIGGGCMSDKVAEYVDADDYGEDAMAAVKLTKKWIGVN